MTVITLRVGWKYSQYEMKGVPLRLEIGPRDIENNSCVLVSRVSRQKTFVSLDNIVEEIEKALVTVHNELYERAEKNLAEKTSVATTKEEFLDIAENRSGFIKAMWCGDVECEEALRRMCLLRKTCKAYGSMGQTILMLKSL